MQQAGIPTDIINYLINQDVAHLASKNIMNDNTISPSKAIGIAIQTINNQVALELKQRFSDEMYLQVSEEVKALEKRNENTNEEYIQSYLLSSESLLDNLSFNIYDPNNRTDQIFHYYIQQ